MLLNNDQIYDHVFIYPQRLMWHWSIRNIFMLRVGNVAFKFSARDVTCFGVKYQQLKNDIDEYSCYLLVSRQWILQIPLKMQRETL